MSKVRTRFDRLWREMLGESSSEAELETAIEAELAKLDSAEAERFIQEFAAQEGLSL